MALSDDLLAPIPGENPAGVNLRYDPIYGRIKEARREDADVPQGEWQTALKTADWPAVVKLATESLSSRSKDLQIAAWLTEGLLQRDGFPGLREGLAVTLGLLENFWDNLYPEVEDDDIEMRAAPLNWLGQYLVTAVRQAPVTRDGLGTLKYAESRTVGYEGQGDSSARNKAINDGKMTAEEFDKSFNATPKSWYKERSAAVQGSLDLLMALDQLGNDRFGPDAPNYLKLRDAVLEAQRAVTQLLEEKLKTDPDPIEAVAPAAAVGSEPTESYTASAGASALATSPAAPPGSREDAAARITAAARYLRSQDPTDPSSYLMLRGFRWGELRGTAGEIDPRKLEAAPTEVRSRLKGLLLSQKWEELLNAAEEVMGSAHGRGWLDLQRYTITACDALGSDYALLGTALRSALQWLLRDLPDLPDLTLMDDSPTANRETRQWLIAEGLVGEDAPEALGIPVSRGGGGGPRFDVLQMARDRARQGDASGAIQMLMRESDRAASERDRFLRRLEAAHLMVDGGFESVALPILREIEKLIENHGLERWESGSTVAHPLGLLYRCVTKLGDGGAQELLLRVSRLDPVEAMKLTGGSSNG
jgi:type VI secretion system protein ImpA